MKHARSTLLTAVALAVSAAFVSTGAHAQTDPSKWGFAQQSYEEVTKYPPPENKLFGYALYKLGYVHWNQGEYEGAIRDLEIEQAPKTMLPWALANTMLTAIVIFAAATFVF